MHCIIEQTTFPVRTTTPEQFGLLSGHYAGGHPGLIWRRYTAVCDDAPLVTAGVLLLSLPVLNARWRAVAWPELFADIGKREAARRANAHVRTISRVVVDPRFRGRGIGSALVRRVIADFKSASGGGVYSEASSRLILNFSQSSGPDSGDSVSPNISSGISSNISPGEWPRSGPHTKAEPHLLEVVASMALVIPVFAAAGMRRIDVPISARSERLMLALKRAGMCHADLIDPETSFAISSAGGGPLARLASALRTWARNSGGTRKLLGGAAQAMHRAAARGLAEKAIYVAGE